MTKLFHRQNSWILGIGLALLASACGGGSSGADPNAGAGGGSGATTSSGSPGPTTSSGSPGPTTSSGGPGPTTSSGAGNPSDARTFDHRHATLDGIPASCIESLKSADFVFHYAHRSHGSQIIVGAESIEAKDPTYGFRAEYCSVPSQTGVFKMWDGMLDNNLVFGEQYWASDAGIAELRTLLSQQPAIRYSMWAWSSEIASQTEEDVQRYLDTLDALGREFPNVTFIYMTGPGDAEYNGVNRAQRNQQIRDFCRERGKILYDFEALDVHYGGERHTAVVDGVEIPMQHPRFDVDTQGNAEYEYTHSTREACEVKASAFWHMMATLEGCAVQ